eukprot:TRINITY_DN5375_c0_g2_i1.p1 TRINITY_DN5375_c0_g2~~TRINITY_DN5375_c0_g2_i1.p1  ORF type:complete len:457 (-),score=105.61 TRINITY_DN5375_c0_g2_i1:78-1448(-)
MLGGMLQLRRGRFLFPSHVSTRIILLVIHGFVALLTAGVIIGYAQLYPLLVNTGVYHHYCPPNTNNSIVCLKQNDKLVDMFTIAASLATFVNVPGGLILDSLGPKITAWTGLALMVPGCILFSYSSASFDAYLPAFLLLSMGGPLIFLSVLPSAALFPNKQALVMTMLNGAYGGGAGVFFLFALMYDYFHVSLKELFLVYAVIAGFLLFVVLLFWPWKPWHDDDQFPTLHATPSIQSIDSDAPVEKKWVRKFKIIRGNVKSPHFMYLCILIPFLILKTNFELSTTSQQLSLLIPTDPHQDLYLTIFGAFVPALGFVSGPLGIVMDKFGISAGTILLLFMSALSSAAGVIANGGVQIFRFAIFSIYFPFIYGVWGATIAYRFGLENYGFLYGLISIFAGCLNFAATPLSDMAVAANSFFAVNIGFLVVNCLLVIYPAIVWIHERRQKTEDAEPLIRQ